MKSTHLHYVYKPSPGRAEPVLGAYCPRLSGPRVEGALVGQGNRLPLPRKGNLPQGQFLVHGHSIETGRIEIKH